MDTADDTTNNEQSIDEIHHIIQTMLYQAHKEEVLDVYENLLTIMWQRITPILGEVTAIAIVQRGLLLTLRKYPHITYVSVLDHGFDFSTLRPQIDTVEYEALCNAFQELIDNLLNILTTLTGDILIRQLIRELKRNL